MKYGCKISIYENHFFIPSLFGTAEFDPASCNSYLAPRKQCPTPRNQHPAPSNQYPAPLNKCPKPCILEKLTGRCPFSKNLDHLFREKNCISIPCLRINFQQTITYYYWTNSHNLFRHFLSILIPDSSNKTEN